MVVIYENRATNAEVFVKIMTTLWKLGLITIQKYVMVV